MWNKLEQHLNKEKKDLLFLKKAWSRHDYRNIPSWLFDLEYKYRKSK